MIDVDKRKAVFLLHQEGMGVREVASGSRLHTSRNSDCGFAEVESATSSVRPLR